MDKTSLVRTCLFDSLIVVLLGVWVGSFATTQTHPTTLTPPAVALSCRFGETLYNYAVSMEEAPTPPGQSGTTLRLSGISSDFCPPWYLYVERVENRLMVYAREIGDCDGTCGGGLLPWSLTFLGSISDRSPGTLLPGWLPGDAYTLDTRYPGGSPSPRLVYCPVNPSLFGQCVAV